jgi:uncharacterized Fe-S cluster-containing radical SAM superfamily protein
MLVMATIKTDDLSAHLRRRSIRPETGELLISRIASSDQERDLSEPANCQGYGRIRHFHMITPNPWPDNPLPTQPAACRLRIPPSRVTTAQVFQNAACNWRCWYCYVPFNLLAANEARADWLTADQLIDLYLADAERPSIIDCSGGQPDLVPERIPWMMQSLRRRSLEHSVYLWSDDNLSNDYFWQYLSADQRRQIREYRNYGRVGCFKGYNHASFSFNTNADQVLFDRQFEIFGRLLALGIDLYGYATFTSADDRGISQDMSLFVDRLQGIHPDLPLRVVPLRIEQYGVVAPRVGDVHSRAMEIQDQAILAWNEELSRRFSDEERSLPMPAIRLGGI